MPGRRVEGGGGGSRRSVGREAGGSEEARRPPRGDRQGPLPHHATPTAPARAAPLRSAPTRPPHGHETPTTGDGRRTRGGGAPEERRPGGPGARSAAADAARGKARSGGRRRGVPRVAAGARIPGARPRARLGHGEEPPVPTGRRGGGRGGATGGWGRRGAEAQTAPTHPGTTATHPGTRPPENACGARRGSRWERGGRGRGRGHARAPPPPCLLPSLSRAAPPGPRRRLPPAAAARPRTLPGAGAGPAGGGTDGARAEAPCLHLGGRRAPRPCEETPSRATPRAHTRGGAIDRQATLRQA